MHVFFDYSFAIPAFSRQYGTSCSTCHVDFPKLNDFGKAFKDAGFKFPKDDETFIKLPPTCLAHLRRKSYGRTRFIPGQFLDFRRLACGLIPSFKWLATTATISTCRIRETPPCNSLFRGPIFSLGLFSIFIAGNFGDGIAFWVDDDISVGGANASGSIRGRLFEIREPRQGS